MEKYGIAKQATDDNIMRRMLFACWITNTTDTHSEYVTLTFFPLQKMVARTCLNVTLYVYCLSYCNYVTNRKMHIITMFVVPLALHNP